MAVDRQTKHQVGMRKMSPVTESKGRSTKIVPCAVDNPTDAQDIDSLKRRMSDIGGPSVIVSSAS